MNKVAMRPERLMYPRPTLLVGSNVDGKANFMAVGGGGVANAEPPMIGVLIRHHCYTLKGVHQNLTFSVNITTSCTTILSVSVMVSMRTMESRLSLMSSRTSVYMRTVVSV